MSPRPRARRATRALVATVAACTAGALGAQPRPPGPVEFTSVIRSQRFSKVIDIEGKSRSDGANAMIWKATGGANQSWDFIAVGGGAYAIVSRNSGLVLDVNGKSTSDGANVQQYRWNGGANQRWYLRETGGGMVRIVNVRSGKCLATDGDRPNDGVNVVQNSCASWSSDVWNVMRGGNYGGGGYTGGGYGGNGGYNNGGYNNGGYNNDRYDNGGGYGSRGGGTPEVRRFGNGGRVEYRGTGCMLNYRGNGERSWTSPQCTPDQVRRADDAWATSRREEGDGDGGGERNGPGYGDDGAPPRIMAGSNREAEVIFTNDCVVYYNPGGRRKSNTPRCTPDQIRRADNAIVAYRREQGW